jgi:light-regulated signal transduction histidine kinase (bacteriophytochrome)
MSVSVLRADGKLWGLIACHHAEPRRVPFAARNACDLLGQMFAVRAAAREDMEVAEARARLRGIATRLLAHMAKAESFPEGLAAARQDLLGLTGATGAAVLADGAIATVGQVPPEAAIRRIADWLFAAGHREVFETSSLGAEMPGGAALAEVASGLLAVAVSRLRPGYVLWFRPELVRTVTWGGDPRKGPAEADRPEPGRLHPRLSFAAWVETVRGRARPWNAAEVEAARDLRSAVVDIVLRSAEERAELTGRLERMNRELAAFSYSVSHDLRAPFRHIVGFAELLREREGGRLSEQGTRYIATIVEAAETAGRLVDALLNFSHMGRAALVRIEFDSAMLVGEVWRSLATEIGERHVELRLGGLPTAYGDPTMLRQVFQNLLSNAVKYSRDRDPAVVSVECRDTIEELVFSVADNGVGFDMAYAHKLFGVFQRLHRVEQFEGIGIGLANVKRIVERHGGRVWAEGVPGRGATFFFSLPHRGDPGGASS